MANEFKIKKGLIVTGANGGTVVDIQGSQGQLFSVTDDLSGSIFAVSDISGVPILDVNSSGVSTFAGDVTATTFLGNSTTQTAGDNSTKIATTAYADAAAAAVPIGNYLPLSAGSGFPLTGDLYVGTSTAGTDRFIRAYFSDNTYTEMRGYGIITNRVGSYYRPASDKTQVLAIGNDGNTWNYVSQNANYHTFGKDTSEWMRIDTNGNVGIGTTSPDYKLDVEGSANNADVGIRINNTFDDNNAASEPNAALFLNAASNNGYLRVHGAPANTVAKHQIDLGSSAGGSFLTFSPSGEKMRITNDGNVGIGTTSPLQPLSIESSTSPLIKIRNTTNAGGAAIEFNDSGTSAATQNGRIVYRHSDSQSQGGGSTFELLGENDQTLQVLNNGRIVVQKTGSATKVGYGFYNDINTGMYSPGADTLALATGGNNRLHINSSGNVGIGTTSPAYKLDVNGALHSSNITLADGIYHEGDTNTYINFLTDTIQMATSGSVRTYINSSGNVGIGTTSPDARLDVIGRVEIDAYAAQAAGNNAFDSGYLRLIGGAKTGWGIDDELGKIEFYGEDTSGVGARNAASIRAVCETGNGTSTTTFSSGLAFYTSSYNAAEGERLRINNDGNVGIGTSTPNAKLDVQGTQGQLFSVTDDLSGDIFSVADISGVPIMNVNSDGTSYFDGNVGIGTTSPTDILDVNGTSIFRRDLTIYHKGNNSSPSYELRFKGTNSSGVDKVHASLESSPYATDTNAGTLLFKTANASNQILDTRMVIDGVGNVGIGTTSPESGYKLDVNGAVSINSVINVSGVDGTNSVSAANNVRLSGYGLMGNRGGLYFTNGDPNGNIQFGVGGVHASNTKLYISSTGNVGIGTTSPTANLHIQENSDPASSVSGLKLSANASGTNKYLPAIEWSYGANGTPSFAKIETIRASSTGGILAFSTATTSSVMTERIRIDSSGNVGIGTTSFSGKLSVKEAGSGVYFTRNSGDNGTTGPVLAFANDSTKSIIAAAGDGIIFRTRTVGGAAFSGSEKMRITSTGNLGIGVTGPSARIHALNSGLAAKFVSSQATALEVQGGGNSQPIARFKDTSASEKVTISSTGNVGIGNTSPANKLDVVGISRFTHSSSTSYRGAIETVVDNAYPTWDIGWLHARTGSSTYGNVARFNDQSGFQIGAITYNGSAGVSYATTSDYRLKENIEEISDSISRVKKLKPCRFNFTAEKNRVVDGFIAHEVQKVVPEAVHGKKDALQEDGSIDAQTLEVSRLIPVLTKALQEAIIKIEELELRIQTIENN